MLSIVLSFFYLKNKFISNFQFNKSRLAKKKCLRKLDVIYQLLCLLHNMATC